MLNENIKHTKKMEEMQSSNEDLRSHNDDSIEDEGMAKFVNNSHHSIDALEFEPEGPNVLRNIIPETPF